jgi:hypothetical protein
MLNLKCFKLGDINSDFRFCFARSDYFEVREGGGAAVVATELN